MISQAEAELLLGLASQVTEGCIVEVGSFQGRSTIALSRGAPDGTAVFAVEPHEPFTGAIRGHQFGPRDRAAFYRNMLLSRAYRNVRLLNVGSDVLSPGWRISVGLLWLDGDHTYSGVRGDLDAWRPHLARNAVVVFDDSSNPRLGPHRVIQEIEGHGFKRVDTVGKVTALRLMS